MFMVHLELWNAEDPYQLALWSYSAVKIHVD